MVLYSRKITNDLLLFRLQFYTTQNFTIFSTSEMLFKSEKITHFSQISFEFIFKWL